MQVEHERAHLCLALLALAGTTGEPSRATAALHATLRDALARLPPTHEHEIVWGPASFRLWWQSSIPAMVVFVTQAADDFHVAIRGGPPIRVWDPCHDSYGWLEQEPWSWTQGTDSLAPAVCSGVHRQLLHLRELVPEDPLPGAGRSLAEFLALRVAERDRDRKLPVHVVGHGLGGTLAMLVALWLRDTQGKVRTHDLAWDPHRHAKLHCRTFAAPSVGNDDFASYIERQLEPDLVYNSLDPALALWDPEALLGLAGRYKPHIDEPALVSAIIEALTNEFERHGVEYEHPSVRVLEGRFNADLPPDYVAQAEYQHLHGYVDLYGLRDSLDVDRIFDQVCGTDDVPVAQ